ncbi:MAG: GAF domain-containing sensor histidine kinase [Anaerolineales bacterium]|nr:GAF domain-containing sensor histidine kinase [Anaerolineales bacterium]
MEQSHNFDTSLDSEIADLGLDSLVVSPNMTELLRSIVAWAVQLFRADAGEIFLWDEEKGLLVQSIGCGFLESYIGSTIKPGEGVVGRVYQSGQPMIVADYFSWPGRLDVFDREEPASEITVPMKWQDRIIGVMGLTLNPNYRTCSEEDIQPAMLFANLAALAIQNHRLCDTLQDRAQKLKAILDREVSERTAQLAHRALQLETSVRVSRQITSILDTETLATSVVNLISQSFDYPYVLIYLRDEKSGMLALRASTVDVSERFRKLKIGSESLNGTAASTNQAILVRDVANYPDYITDMERMADSKSELVIPLRMGSRVLGTLDVISRRADDFGEEDLRLIQSLGDQIAIAVENARLYDQSRQLAALEERSYLARELHDSITQLLFSITLTSETTRMLLKSGEPQVISQVDRLQVLAHQAMNEMRALIHQLRPLPEEQKNLTSHVRDLVAERSERDGIEIELHIEGEKKLPSRYELGLYRIVQEALNNIIKHANTNSARVVIIFQDDTIELMVQDRGVGFDPAQLEQESATLGLTSMRERVELLGGKLSIESAPGEGTCIKARVAIVDEGL